MDQNLNDCSCCSLEVNGYPVTLLFSQESSEEVYRNVRNILLANCNMDIDLNVCNTLNAESTLTTEKQENKRSLRGRRARTT